MKKSIAIPDLGKWFNRESAGGGPGWDRYDSTGKASRQMWRCQRRICICCLFEQTKSTETWQKGISKFVKRKRAASGLKEVAVKESAGGKGMKLQFLLKLEQLKR
jgi:hypothetical protein